MARILYGILAEGNGHVTRSWGVIQRLRKEHQIIALTGGNAFEYLKKKHEHSVCIEDLCLAYRDNKIVPLRTFFKNLRNARGIFRSLRVIDERIKKFRPDVLVNDMSALTNLVALFRRIPIITLDNNQLVLKTRLDLPKRWSWAILKAKLAIRLMVQTADFRIITSFFFPPVVQPNVKLVSPVLRREVLALKPTTNGPVLVYQTSDTNEELLDDLERIGEPCVIYGFGARKRRGPLRFKEFSDRGFLKDLERAKAVIINGGFSLMAEALHLKKPVLSIPVQGQIEQMINALYLQRKGWGMMLERSDEKGIRRFLKNRGLHKKHLKYCRFDHDQAVEVLSEKIKRFTKSTS